MTSPLAFVFTPFVSARRPSTPGAWALTLGLLAWGGIALAGQQAPTSQAPTSPPSSPATPGSSSPQASQAGAMDAAAGQAAPVSDPQLQQQVQAALDADPDLHAAGVTVGVHQGVVTLQGSVAGKRLKRKAAQTVQGVAGVQRVENHLTVGDAAGQSGANPAMPGTTVPVTGADTTSGTATPAGHAATPPNETAASSPAMATAGSGLDMQVMQALLSDPELSKYALSATVANNNTVVLHGTLPTPEDKLRARSAVKQITGIRKVRNEIYVNPAITPLQGHRADMQALGLSGSNAAGTPAGQASPATPPDQNAAAPNPATPDTSAPNAAPQNAASQNAAQNAASPNAAATPAGNGGGLDPASQVQGQFKNDPALAAVMVESTPHGLLLTGTVANKADKSRAGSMARQTAPNLKVKNKIMVQKYGMASPTGSQGTPPPK